ncbi:hypothetical protein OG512_47735 [Streptomyces sp. NBC_01378]|uniref:aldose epimerase family protein n=1 Tax=Streptomyces sp. NBC_01378 TaxID=2903844 RepID=UPI00324C4814
MVQLGGALRDYLVNGRPVLDGFNTGSAITGGRGQLLVPWPNRVGGGRYRFDGRSLQLPLSEVEKGNAMHGLLRWTLWKLLARTEDSVLLGTTLCPRTSAFLAFAGLFAILAIAPRAQRGLWELVIGQKTALVVMAAAMGDVDEARVAGLTDLGLVVVVAAAYMLCRGWYGWRTSAAEPAGGHPVARPVA